MNATKCITLTAILGMTSLNLAAQFSSGSTGSNGALNVTSNTTLNLPPDGIFHFTTITVAPGQTLSFKRNALNTPVHLLATGTVLINGDIDVSGSTPTNSIGAPGGPGGFDGGYGGHALNTVAGAGQGPGGGPSHAITGVFWTNYGNALLIPIIGGSGGAGINGSPNGGGAGGGGAIVVASTTRITINGAIYARGGDYFGAGSGSGGAIRIVAPIVDGDGFLDTWSRGGSLPYFGRMRVDCEDKYSFRNLNFLYGTATRGSQMIVFPPSIPRLDILEAAGRVIPEGTPSGVSIELPLGSPTNQIVRVQARNFTNDIPINVVVTPENGPRRVFPATIQLASGNPPQADVTVSIPVGIISRIHAWTR